METMEKTNITVEATVNASVEKVWEAWNNPTHITQWCAASDDWHAPSAENDLRKDGRFKTTMAAKDGSMSFDFSGVYDERSDRAHTLGELMDLSDHDLLDLLLGRKAPESAGLGREVRGHRRLVGSGRPQ